MNTLQELIKIRDGAPEGATHIDDSGYYLAYLPCGHCEGEPEHDLFSWDKGKWVLHDIDNFTQSLSDISNLIVLMQENERLKAEILGSWEYESEYDGRVYQLCTFCDGQDGDHDDDCIINQLEGKSK